MPRSWSEAVKSCREHPSGISRGGQRRACSCKVGWRYRMGRPDAVSGKLGKPEWSQVFGTKAEADAHQLELRKAISEGRYAHDRGKLVKEWVPDWLDLKERLGRRDSTITDYRSKCDEWIIPALGEHRLGRVSRGQVQGFVDSLAHAKQKGLGRTHLEVTPGNVRAIHRVLRSCLADALKDGLVTFNAAEGVRLPPATKHKPASVGTDRIGTWLDWIAQQEDRLEGLAHMASTYGPRRGEILGLRRSDIDWRENLIQVEQAVLEAKGSKVVPCSQCGMGHRGAYFDGVKTAAGERVWPLVPAIRTTLKRHLSRQAKERAAYGAEYKDHGLVFCAPDGSPLRPDWVSDWFRRTFRESGAAEGLAKEPSMKVLRSSAVTVLSEAGVPLEVIQLIVGHEPGSEVTRRHYLAVSVERARAEMAAIAAGLGRADRRNRSDRQSDRGA